MLDRTLACRHDFYLKSSPVSHVIKESPYWYLRFSSDTQFHSRIVNLFFPIHQESMINETKTKKNRLNGTPCAFEGWIIPTDCIFECSCSNFPYNSVYILTAQLYKKKSCFFSNDHYSQNIFKKTRKQDAQEIEGVSFGASRFCKLKSCTDTEEEVVVYCARS